jgi:cyclic pyranopterin phosphate synthase
MSSRSIDGHKLSLYPERVAEYLQKGDCFPLKVEVGPVNFCNNRCVYCALDHVVGKSGKSMLDKGSYFSFLEDFARLGGKAVYYAGEGEPLLHPEMAEFLKKTNKEGLGASMSTNGRVLGKEMAEKTIPHLSWIRIGIDAGTSKTYSKIHGVKERVFQQVLDNVEYIGELKSKKGYDTHVGIQALVLGDPSNTSEMKTLTKLVKERGVNNLQIKPYSQHPSSKNKNRSPKEEFLLLKDELTPFNDDSFEVVVRDSSLKRVSQEKKYDKCRATPFSFLLSAKGDAIPCNIFYGEESKTFGNINEASFQEIWEGEKRKKILEEIINVGRGCRKGCPLDAMNIYLDRLHNPKPGDEFI